jgi:hypothetical protein
MQVWQACRVNPLCRYLSDEDQAPPPTLPRGAQGRLTSRSWKCGTLSISRLSMSDRMNQAVSVCVVDEQRARGVSRSTSSYSTDSERTRTQDGRKAGSDEDLHDVEVDADSYPDGSAQESRQLDACAWSQVRREQLEHDVEIQTRAIVVASYFLLSDSHSR